MTEPSITQVADNHRENGNKSPRFALEKAVLASGMPPAARHIMHVLLSHTDRENGLALGKFSPSIRRLTIETGYAKSTVEDYLDLLTEHGWVSREKTKGRRTEYTLMHGRPFGNCPGGKDSTVPADRTVCTADRDSTVPADRTHSDLDRSESDQESERAARETSQSEDSDDHDTTELHDGTALAASTNTGSSKAARLSSALLGNVTAWLAAEAAADPDAFKPAEPEPHSESEPVTQDVQTETVTVPDPEPVAESEPGQWSDLLAQRQASERERAALLEAQRQERTERASPSLTPFEALIRDLERG